MDATYDWKRAEGVEALVERISLLSQELQKICFSKWGRAKRITVDAYAPAVVVELLKSSSLWKDAPVAEDLGEGLRFNKPTARHAADFLTFQLHDDHHMCDDTVRVVALFAIEDGKPKTWYGNVKISD